MPLVILSSNGHYPDLLVEVSEKELKEIYRIQGKRFLFDTEEGRQKIKELKARAIKDVREISIYQ